MSSHLEIVHIIQVQTHLRRCELIPERRTPILSMQHKATIHNNPKQHVRSSVMSSHLEIVHVIQTHTNVRRWELIPDRRTHILSMSHKRHDNPKRHVRSSVMSSHLEIVHIIQVQTHLRRWELIPDRRTPILSTHHKAVLLRPCRGSAPRHELYTNCKPTRPATNLWHDTDRCDSTHKSAS
jgi:hypothetical protein